MLTVSHKALSIEILITASLRPNYWPKLTTVTIGLPTFVIMKFVNAPNKPPLKLSLSYQGLSTF